jgi:D-alanine-D-alanine ligase
MAPTKLIGIANHAVQHPRVKKNPKVGPVEGPLRLRPSPLRRKGRLDQLQSQVERTIQQVRFAVIHGGDKSKDGAVIFQTANARSWKSYEAVANDIAAALERLGMRQVLVLPDDMNLGERLRSAGIQMAWLNTGGVQGYHPTSHAAAMLEMFGIPYVGHDPLNAAVLDNKHLFKHALESLGLPTSPFISWHPGRGASITKDLPRFASVFRNYAGPFVVKPVSGRASLLVTVVDDLAGLDKAVTEVFRETDNLVLVEKYLPGKEYCIAVSGPVISRDRRLDRLDTPFVFAPIERQLGAEERIFTSMDVAPITGDRIQMLSSDRHAAQIAELRALATQTYVELDLQTLIRLDLRADANGVMHVLEANPKPDLKAPNGKVTSIIGAGLAGTGMDYDDLILSLLSDRLDLLFAQLRGRATHITALAGIVART